MHWQVEVQGRDEPSSLQVQVIEMEWSKLEVQFGDELLSGLESASD